MTASRRRWRLGAAIAGLALLAAAAIVAFGRHRAALDTAATAVTERPGLLAALAGLVLANMALTGALFTVLMRRFARVGLAEMEALLAAATLANYLPLRPGLFGRVAWHRAVHGVAVTDTARTVIEAMVMSGVVAAWLAGAALLLPADGWAVAAAVLGPLPPLAGAALLPAVPGPARRLAGGLVLRWLDLLVWAARYEVAFALIDAPIDHRAALALAAVATVATLVPLVSNGLGLREWAIGVFAPWLGAAPLALALGADLLHRGVEVAVVALVGGASAWALARGVRSRVPSPP